MEKYLLILLIFSGLIGIANADSADCNTVDSCMDKGMEYRKKEQFRKAKPYFLKGCNLGDIGACTGVGHMNMETGDYKQAIKYLTRSCDSDNSSGCYLLGRVYLHKIKPHQIEKGKKFSLKGCYLGDIGACTLAGMEYYNGRQFIKKAKFPLEQACFSEDEGSIAIACNALGTMYSLKNVEKSLKLYQRGCDIGEKPLNEPACKNAITIATVIAEVADEERRRPEHHYSCSYEECSNVLVEYGYPSNTYVTECSTSSQSVYAKSASEAEGKVYKSNVNCH